MAAKVSRRELAALAALPLAGPVSAMPQQAAQEAPTDDLAIQRANASRNSDAITKIELPMAVEPAFLFKP